MTATRTRLLGTTEILEPVGKGGMAQVYRGVQRPLGRDVAVKVILPQLSKRAEMLKRFRREARILATLQHENIVAVFDLVEKNDQIFMIMEFVHGVDFEKVLADVTKLPVDVALIVGLGVCRAVEHAHFRRVIHRDIKPSNVLLSFEGEVKLADFGIAREVQPSELLTKSGQVLGTPAYLAPELFKGHKHDHRSDLYALGVLLFHAIAGQRPFNLNNPGGLFGAIASGDRHRLRDLVPDCPRAVEKIVDRCLEVKPERRWQRASDLRKELEEAANKLVGPSHAARLVTFLYDRGYVQPAQLATLDVDELAELNPALSRSLKEYRAPLPGDDPDAVTVVARPARSSFGRRLVLAGLSAALLTAGAYWLDPAMTSAAFRWIAARVAGSP